MDNELHDMLRQMKQQTRGRMLRPPTEVRSAIRAWVGRAQASDRACRAISSALGVDKDRLKAWQRITAQRNRPTHAGAMSVIPLQIAPTAEPAAARIDADEVPKVWAPP